MKNLIRICVLAMFCLHGWAFQGDLEEAIESFNRAFLEKDVETIRGLLAEEVLLYEHSVKNDGREEVYGHHLKPEIEAFQDLELSYSDVRVSQSGDLALVTRNYTVKGKLGERTVDAGGNETMAWKRVGGQWKIIHIHWSHACPRTETHEH